MIKDISGMSEINFGTFFETGKLTRTGRDWQTNQVKYKMEMLKLQMFELDVD